MTPNGSQDVLRVYCAGPLFNRAERAEMSAIADTLCEAGYQVYLPHRDGMEFRLVHRVLVERGWQPPQAAEFLHAAIFALDVFQLAVDCDALVWNLNGRTPDEGAVSEAAIAWTLGKPVVAYQDDVRSLIAGRANPLVVGLVDFRTLDEIDDIPQALSAAILAQESLPSTVDKLSPPLQRAARQGQQLWEMMTDVKAQQDDKRIADIVTELFAAVDTVPPVAADGL